MTPRRRQVAAGPTISLILLAGETYVSPADALRRAEVVDVVPVVGRFDTLAAAFVDALARASGEFVLATTPDAGLPEDTWASLLAAMAENPDAGAFRLRQQGLPADRAWRGRRARNHERNLETLRFAHLIAPGSLVVRRDVMQSAAEDLAFAQGSDWWRVLTRRIAASARLVEVEAPATRAALLPGEPACPGFAPRADKVDVLVLGQIEVSTSLYFDFLESSPDLAVAYRALSSLQVDAPHLAGAGLVVLVRTLHRFWDEGVIDFLRAAGAPYVWFTDDNFLALRSEGDASSFYNPARMRRALAGAAQVWASTGQLAAAMRPLHPDVKLWGPVLDPRLHDAAPAGDGPLTVVLPGGDFRASGLEGAPLDRLRAMAEAEPLRAVATTVAAKALAEALGPAEVIALPQEPSFRQFVRHWRRFGADILLHPAGATANAPFKCPTAVIVAGYLGAAPVVADEPAYAGWGENEGVLSLGDDALGLIRAASGVRKADWRADMGARLARALSRRFGGEGRLAMIGQVISDAQAPRRSAAQVLAASEFRRRRLWRRLARWTRWLRR